MDVKPDVGSALRSIRQSRGLSLDKAATLTGVSKAMMGQIERGESSPTIATVWKLATGLSCSFTALLGEQSAPSFGGTEQDPKMRVVTHFPFDASTGIEIFDVVLEQHHEQLSTPHQPGVIEHIYVREGRLALLVEGEWLELDPGQRHKLRADRPHGYRDLTGKTVFTDVIYYPEAKKGREA